MKFRRLKAAILTGIMALALAVPAYAAADPLNPTVKVTGTTQLPTINLQMPTDPAVILNPYKLQVTMGKDKINNQIASPVMSVVNLSDCAIQVGAGVSVTVAGNVDLATATTTTGAPATPATGKNNVFINIAAKVGDKAGEALLNASGAPDTGVKSANLTATKADLDATFKEDGSSTGAQANTLAAATNGKVATTGGVFNFTFYGDATTKNAWTAKDTATPTIVFKFVPVSDYPQA